MSNAERIPRLFTPEEYLLIERDAPTRSEYENGQIYAMAGASKPHRHIIENLTGLLYPQIRRTPCHANSHDAKVRIGASKAYYYPDIVMTCGEELYLDASTEVILNPNVIIEVLSPSTEGIDRVTKYNFYREIETLQDYLIVSQSEYRVEHHFRDEKGEWQTIVATAPETFLTLRGAPVTLTLADIYDRVLNS